MPNFSQYTNNPVPSLTAKIKGPGKSKGAMFAESGGLQAAGNIASSIAGSIPTLDKTVNENDAAMENLRSNVNSALMKSGNPFAMAAGAVNTLIDKTGGFTDASQGLGKGTDFLNKAAALAIPGAGWIAGKTDSYKVSDTLSNSSGFANTLSDGKTAQGNAGAKLLFGKKKANRMINNSKQDDLTASDIINQNKDLLGAQAGRAEDIAANNTFKNLGGWQSNGGVTFGKEGMKLKGQWAKELINRMKNGGITQGILKHAEGGKIGEQSVIPGGALHAHKHNIKAIDEDLANAVTHKGVPVVSFEDGGEIEQHAEVERGEIIFRKEITDKLEKLWRDGSEEAMIEAGKLITEEVIANTIDKSGEYEINYQK